MTPIKQSQRDTQILFEIKHFFSEIPEAEIKANLWEMLRGWIHFISEAAKGEEISDMLFFYERLLEFMDLMASTTANKHPGRSNHTDNIQ